MKYYILLNGRKVAQVKGAFYTMSQVEFFRENYKTFEILEEFDSETKAAEALSYNLQDMRFTIVSENEFLIRNIIQ